MISDSRMRLTLVTETFPPEVNGAARTLGRWVNAFRERGHQVRVIRPRQPTDNPSPDHVHGVPLPFYPQVRFGIVSPVRLRSMILQTAPDLVHVATEGPLGATVLGAAAGLGILLVSSFHTNFDHYVAHYGFPGLEYVLTTYLAWFHNQTAVTLAPSEGTRQRLHAIGVPHTAIWARGVDAEIFHPRYRNSELRRSLGLDDDGVLLLYVGRLAVEKNLSALLEAYARLRWQMPEPARNRIRLALVGDGPLAGVLKTQQMPGVILAGEKHGVELSQWYASADVFTFPSRSETFGNVVLEAQASGLPVVGYDCQAINEHILHGDDGLLVSPDGDFAEAVMPLCTDRARRAYYGFAARAKAELKGWSAIFDELETLYRELIEKHRSPTVVPFRGEAQGRVFDIIH